MFLEIHTGNHEGSVAVLRFLLSGRQPLLWTSSSRMFYRAAPLRGQHLLDDVKEIPRIIHNPALVKQVGSV